MSIHELEKLLGGYASDTLTEEERKALFEAALHDQDLFNALADEQALKELLEDPASRQRLLASLEKPAPHTVTGRRTLILEWFKRPVNLGLAGTLATALIAFVVVLNLQKERGLPPPREVFTTESRPATESRPNTPSKTDGGALDDQDQELEFKRMRKLEPSPPSKAKKESRSRISRHDRPTGLAEPDVPVMAERAPRTTLEQRESDGGRAPSTPRLAPPLPDEHTKQLSSSKTGPTREESFADQANPRSQDLLASTSSPLIPGKARDLFYGKAARAPSVEEHTRQESPTRPIEPERPARAQESQAEAQPEAGRFSGSALVGSALRTPGAFPFGLRYSILKLAPDGTYAEVDAAGPFSAHDALRLTLETNKDGYLYVIAQLKKEGGWTWLFPTRGSGDATTVTARVVSRTRYTIPEVGTSAPSSLTSPLTTFVIFSGEPIPEFQNLMTGKRAEKGLGGQVDRATTAFLSRTGNKVKTQRVIIEKVEASAPDTSGEHATYIVAAEPASTSPILFEIHLAADEP